MPAVVPSNVTKRLTSEWGALSSHLIADFYMVAKNGDGTWSRPDGEPIVSAPLSEASMEVALNWQSPFEQSGAESKAPALMAMLQSGVLAPIVSGIMGMAGVGGGKSQGDVSIENVSQFLGQFEGKTGITKLNSTQVFTGMPPIKIQVTALFRAWKDPINEVENPFDQLMHWALPEYLESRAEYATLLGRAAGEARSLFDETVGAIDVLLPSKSPVRIAMKYKNRLYSPLVIESITMPMQSPINLAGHYAQLTVPMTLCTLTALDRNDWANTKKIQI